MSGIADGPPVLLAFEPWSVAEALVAEVQGEPGWTRAEADAMRETWVLIGRRMVQLRGITEADWIAYVKDEFPSDLRAEWFAWPRCEECLNDEYGPCRDDFSDRAAIARAEPFVQTLASPNWLALWDAWRQGGAR